MEQKDIPPLVEYGSFGLLIFLTLVDVLQNLDSTQINAVITLVALINVMQQLSNYLYESEEMSQVEEILSLISMIIPIAIAAAAWVY